MTAILKLVQINFLVFYHQKRNFNISDFFIYYYFLIIILFVKFTA